MATLSPSTTTGTLFSTTPLNKKNQLLSKPSPLSLSGSSSKITCRLAAQNDDHHHDPQNQYMIDRRNFLLGLGGLYGAAAATPTTVAAPTEETATLPEALGKGFRVKVGRPKKSRSKREKIEKEEVLEVTLELEETDKYVKFDVYLNDEFDHGSDKGQTKPDIKYAGSFTRLPELPSKRRENKTKAILKMPISEVIQDIGADDHDYVYVVFVARTGQEGINITDVKITYI